MSDLPRKAVTRTAKLAEDLEELLRRALLQLAADDLRGLPADPLAQPPGRSPGEAER